MECKNCRGLCVKKGCQNRRQKYYCKSCELYQQKTYTYKICTLKDEETIVKLNNIGVSISGISKFTGMSKANVINKMKQISRQIITPEIKESHQDYEVDEMYTFIGNKKQAYYITYALNKKTKQVIDLVVGSRTKETIGKVINSLISLKPKQIFTDKLNIYPSLIEKKKHVASAYKINHIERFNLTLRTHLKRLSRKTICFSRSKEMLENCLRIYLWAEN